METTVTFNTDKIKDFGKSLKSFSKSYVKLGVMNERNQRVAVYPDEDIPLTNVEIARQHEFGTGSGGIVRSILRKPMNTELGNRLQNVSDNTWRKNLNENGLSGLLEVMGQTGLKLINDTFKEQGIPSAWQYLSNKTLKHREENGRFSTRILQDSYQLQDSFGYEVVK